MHRRRFIVRTLAVLSAVAAFPRRLFAAKPPPLDFTVTTPKLRMNICDFNGATLAALRVKTLPASEGKSMFTADGFIAATGTANHGKLFRDGHLIATFPVTGNRSENGIVFESSYFRQGFPLSVSGTIGFGAD